MDQLKVWVLVGAVAGMWAIIMLFANQGLKKLDEMVKELKQLNGTTREHSQQIKHLETGHDKMHDRLNNHGERIKKLEILHNHKNHIEP